MIPLFDPRWKLLKGGRGIPYDPSLTLLKLEHSEHVWDELWSELHHQGDVGEASYAAVPHLVRISKEQKDRSWNFYSLVSIIEIERHRKSNPQLPEWLKKSYSEAIEVFGRLAVHDLNSASDPLLIQSILGAIAIWKNLLKLGSIISCLDNSEIDNYLEDNYS